MGIELILALSFWNIPKKTIFQTEKKKGGVLKFQDFNLECNTLRSKLFGVGDFWLETRVIIKIESHPSENDRSCNFHNRPKQNNWPITKADC